MGHTDTHSMPPAMQPVARATDGLELFFTPSSDMLCEGRREGGRVAGALY